MIQYGNLFGFQYTVIIGSFGTCRGAEIVRAGLLAVTLFLSGCTSLSPEEPTSAGIGDPVTVFPSTSESNVQGNQPESEEHEMAGGDLKGEPQKPTVEGDPDAQHDNKRGNQAVFNLLPLLSVRLEKVDHEAGHHIGAYTRLLVKNGNDIIGAGEEKKSADRENSHLSKNRLEIIRICDGSGKEPEKKERCYKDEHQGFWAGLFRVVTGSNKEVSRVLSVKVKLKNPQVDSTKTLAAASYRVGSKYRGETWNTEVNGSQYFTPYFRIENSSLVHIEANINASISSQNQISSKLLNIVQGAAELASPGAALLTVSTSSRLTQISQFTDSSLSSLFSNELAETSSHEVPQSAWFDEKGQGKLLATINGWFPPSKKLTSPELRRIGQWKILADDPIISIFSSSKVSDCAQQEIDHEGYIECAGKKVFPGLSPAQIMNFHISENLTLKQALITDNAISSAINRVNKTGGESLSQEAYALCGLIDSKAQNIGLNRIDTAALFWAFSYDPLLDEGKGKVMREISSCMAAVMARNLGLIPQIKQGS